MKSFSQFFKEAVETTASTQAKRLGLVGDGHGGWYDRKGKFTAKTVSGKLHFTGSAGAGEDKTAKQGKPTAAVRTTKRTKGLAGAVPTPKGTDKKLADIDRPVDGKEDPRDAEAPEAGVNTNGVVVTFGRFNPPTIGHGKLLDFAGKEAERRDFDLKIYPSRTQDKKKNPMEPGKKIEFMKMAFDDYADNIIDDPEAKTIFDVLLAAKENEYKNLVIVCGGDRLSEFQSLAHKYNGPEEEGGLYQFGTDGPEVLSAGDRDPDAEGVEGMSSSKMRKSASDDDFPSFAKGIPDVGNVEKKNLFNSIRKSMGIDKSSVRRDKAQGSHANVKECAVWEYAPKLDVSGLREAYRLGNIYPVGALVEHLNTGELGRITRRGTNYVICMTAEGTMFKAWLTDLSEAYEVGTDAYREYVQSCTPGQGVVKFGEPKTRIKTTTPGSYWDGKPKSPAEDPASGPGTKYNDKKIPYKVGER
tara:strand:- start:3054 stop:4466 length:1413 start_codon:yes stop_codon:yes gene_type:complete